jgi:hypothetical protein
MEHYKLYSDESGGAGERLRALGAVAGSAAALKKLEARLKDIARENSVVDLKWSQVRTRENRLRACRDFLRAAVEAMAAGEMTLGVLLWEVPLGQHQAKPREDKKQLHHMYARLLKKEARHWTPGQWVFHPDLRTGMKWKDILDEVNGAGKNRFTACRPLASRDSSLVQLADLVVGMARTSREKSVQLEAWRQQGGLSPGVSQPDQGMAALENRFAIRSDFVENCRRYGLGPLNGFENNLQDQGVK